MEIVSRYWLLFKNLKTFLGPKVWRLFIKSFFVGVLWFAVEGFFIFVLQGFLRALNLVPSDKLFLPSFYPEDMVSSVLLLVGFGVVRSCIYSWKFYLGGMTNQEFVRLQRKRMMNYSLRYASEIQSHEVLSQFGDRIKESGSVLLFLSRLLNTVTSSGLMILAALKLAPFELLIGGGVLFLAMLPFRRLNKSIAENGKAIVVEWNKINQLLVTGLRNHYLLRIYGLIDREVEDGCELIEKYNLRYREQFMRTAIKSGFPLLMGVLVISGLTFFSLNYLHTPGAKLLSFFYLFMRISQGLSDSSQAVSSLRFNLPSLKSIYGLHQKMIRKEALLTDLKIQSGDVIGNTDTFSSRGVLINAHNLHFRYEPDSAELYGGLNLEVEKGGVLLLKGPSGSGKSTFLNLVLGLYSPTEGQLLINGKTPNELGKSYFRHIGYVGPEPYLIAGTLRDNLLYGHWSGDTVSDEVMWEALRKAQLDEVCEALPRGLSEYLHEHMQLSTGQKQRLTLARALLREPSLLILDEATANLDPDTEQHLIDALCGILQKQTTLVVSHKNSFDAIATQTVILPLV